MLRVLIPGVARPDFVLWRSCRSISIFGNDACVGRAVHRVSPGAAGARFRFGRGQDRQRPNLQLGSEGLSLVPRCCLARTAELLPSPDVTCRSGKRPPRQACRQTHAQKTRDMGFCVGFSGAASDHPHAVCPRSHAKRARVSAGHTERVDGTTAVAHGRQDHQAAGGRAAAGGGGRAEGTGPHPVIPGDKVPAGQ